MSETGNHHGSNRATYQSEMVFGKGEVVIEETPSETSLNTNGFFEKYIGLPPIIAFGLTLNLSWEAAAITFGSVLINGGPPVLIWGMLICLVGCSATAASLGEMASVDPAVGAQYRWAARFAPKALEPHFWGFMQGWLTVVAWIAAAAATPFSAALLVQSLTILNNPGYVPERWHTTLIGCAIIVVIVIWNLWARRLLVAIELGTGIIHLLLFVVFVVLLSVLVPRAANSFVWTQVFANVPTNSAGTQHGWTDPGAAFCVGLLTPAVCLVGFDGILHMSAETKDPARTTPRAMLGSVLINGTTALGFVIALMYALGDTSVTLDPTPGYLPIVGVILGATGSKAATTVLISLLTTVVVASCFTIFASISRLTWAFAKDGGLPFPQFFGHINPTLQVPVNALGLVSILCAALLCVNIGSTVAFYAILSLCTFGIYFSYCIPLAFLIISKLRGEGPGGAWHLGKYGILINTFALCFCIFLSVWLTFPVSLPVAASTFNYASVIWGGCMIFAAIDYVISGRKRFVLPVDKDGRFY